ncbi:copia protein [Tanacetum coccineum]
MGTLSEGVNNQFRLWMGLKGPSTLEPLMELIIEHCTGKYNHIIGNMMNEVDIENLTIEQYLMLTQEKQTHGMIRTEFGRIITKNIDDMTIAEYIEYEAEMIRDLWRYTRNSGLTTLGGTKNLENMHQLDKLKTNAYFPSIPTCFEPAQPRIDDIHDPSRNDPNDYHLFTPQSHYETKEVSFDEDVDEWLNEELSKRMNGQDKEEEKDALIDILKQWLKNAKDEEGDTPKTLPYQQISNEINAGSFTLPCTIGNLKINVMTDVGARINMMPKSLFEHLMLTNLKKTCMDVEMGDMTKKAPLGIVENIPVQINKFLFHSDFVVIDTLEGPNETILSGFLLKFFYMASSIQKSEYFNPHEIENDDSPALEQRTFHYCEECIGTVDSSSDSKENEVGSHLSENVSRWHVCKLVHIIFEWYDEGFEEEELWKNGIEEIDYTPPVAKNETFEVHRFLYEDIGIQGLLNSYSCGSKVLS